MLEPWPTGEAYTFNCPSGHQEPEQHCRCGIHAFYSYKSLCESYYANEPDDWLHASGVVAATGGLVLHEVGFRAERVTVQAIFGGPTAHPLPIPREEIAEAYGIPVITGFDYEDFCKDKGLVVLDNQ